MWGDVELRKGKWLGSCVPLLLTLVLLSSQISRVLPAVTSLSTDKSEYYRGEAVTISGKASPDEWVGIQVNDPNGINLLTDSVKAGGDGSFTVSLGLSSTATYGTYTVYATPPSPPKTTSFRVVEAVVPPPPPPPPAKKSSSITMTLNATIVVLSESVAVSGFLDSALNTVVEIRITCPNGTEFTESVPVSGGFFTHVFKPDNAGIWSARASWPGNAEYYGCSSSVLTVIARGCVALQIVAVPMLTNVGGMLIVYVSTSPPLADRPLTLSYVTNKTAVWKSIGTFETSSEGVLAFLFTPGETGKYWFKVEWVGDPSFMSASANSSEVLVIAETLAPQDILNALSQVKALQKLLEEKEAGLKNCSETLSMLQKDVEGLQRGLSDAQTRILSLEWELAETKVRLSETESRLMFTGILAFIVGLLIGITVAFLVLRSRFQRREPLVSSPSRR